jgi:hypothetical protein
LRSASTSTLHKVKKRVTPISISSMSVFSGDKQ